MKWGPVYSQSSDGSRAVAVGRAWGDDENGGFNFEARIYDRSPSSRLCGYVRVKFINKEEGRQTIRSARKCGPVGFTRLTDISWENDVADTALVQVCHWDRRTAGRKYCGKWEYAYRFEGAGQPSS
ncbi:hypothetical protein [Rhizohabitans arisaemae]|uniref:hypothetical protein n=1 Tax=Rhizohabitans arisaemae TaxID=2720610 RepID=UPI0024B0CCF2|nr:hypothetical protein [Rhizohabitans arisaemae]